VWPHRARSPAGNGRRGIGPLITGLLQTHVGFHYGFGAAAIGTALGLAQYVAFRRNLGDHGRTVPNPLPRNGITWAIGAVVVVAAVIAVAFATGLVKLSNLSQVRGCARVHPVVPRQCSALVVVPSRSSRRSRLPMSGTSSTAVPALLVVGIMAVFAVSELLLSPNRVVGHHKACAGTFRAQMMALYFFSVGLGTSMSGLLAGYYDPPHEFAYFGIIGAVAIVVGVIVFAMASWISRLMEGVH
jgi:dipeptide/tripeptide permease